MTDLQKRFPYIRMTDEEASFITECANDGGFTIENPDVVRISLAIMRMSPEKFYELYPALKEIFS